MFNDILNHMDLSALTTAGLVLFFIVFVAVSIYAFTRPPAQAAQWSRIPLTRDADVHRTRCAGKEEAES
jgi:cbb3-type cytochrome oxidase subunit 3